MTYYSPATGLESTEVVRVRAHMAGMKLPELQREANTPCEVPSGTTLVRATGQRSCYWGRIPLDALELANLRKNEDVNCNTKEEPSTQTTTSNSVNFPQHIEGRTLKWSCPTLGMSSVAGGRVLSLHHRAGKDRPAVDCDPCSSPLRSSNHSLKSCIWFKAKSALLYIHNKIKFPISRDPKMKWNF